MDNFQENIERIKIMVIGASTDIAIDEKNEQEYYALRKTLLNDDRFKKLGPKLIRTCSSLKEFRRELQAISGNYAGRRSHIKEIFIPVLEEDIMTDAIADIVQQVDYGKLNLLPKDIQDKGREMADVYLYLYCIENSFRIFISEIMKGGQVLMPKKVQETIDKLKASEKESKYLPVRGDNDLYYCDFIELGKIMISNWEVFGEYFPKQNEHWLNVMIDELYKIRCLVAHNSYVGDHERQSLKVYYKNITLQLKISK